MRGVTTLLGLLESQWRRPRALESRQLGRLKRLVLHAYHKVPYYRELFDSAGVRPGDIRSLDVRRGRGHGAR